MVRSQDRQMGLHFEQLLFIGRVPAKGLPQSCCDAKVVSTWRGRCRCRLAESANDLPSDSDAPSETRSSLAWWFRHYTPEGASTQRLRPWSQKPLRVWFLEPDVRQSCKHHDLSYLGPKSTCNHGPNYLPRAQDVTLLHLLGIHIG